MKEKVLYFDNLTAMEDVEKTLISFISDLINKKRNEMYDGAAYKTIMLCLTDKCGLKTTEHNGIDSHHHSEINLFRYLNDEDNFLSTEDMINPFLYNRDAKSIRSDVLAVRFSSALDGLLVELDIPMNYNEFQLTNLILLFKLIKEARERNHYNRVEVVMSIASLRNKLHCGDLTNEKYNEFLEVINNLLSNINKHTK